MKSKGQTLVLFVALIPFLLMVLAFVVDVGLMYKETVRLRGVTRDVIRDTYDSQDIDEVIGIFKENDIVVDDLEVVFGREMSVNNSYTIASIFGKVLGFDEYTISVDMIGYKEDGEVLIRE